VVALEDHGLVICGSAGWSLF